MTLHWTEKKRAIARIGAELQKRGWMIYGYDPGESDPMTDYFRAASWEGVAVFEGQYPGVVACVQVTDFTVETHAGKDSWPQFSATPKRKGWHIERDGEIVESSLAYMMKCSRYRDWEQHVEQVAVAIEQAAERALIASPGERPGRNLVRIEISLEYDRDWTWLFFPEKPEAEVREQLKSIGARWSNKRQGWYFRQHVELDELAWLFADQETTNDTTKEETVPLVLNDEGMDVEPANMIPEAASPDPEGSRRAFPDPGRSQREAQVEAFDRLRGEAAEKGIHVGPNAEAYTLMPEWSLPFLPGIGQSDKDDPIIWLKFFHPLSSWSWYLTEYDPDERLAFGLVAGFETEIGYFSIEELESLEVRGLKIEREIWTRPGPIRSLDEYREKWGEDGPYRGKPALEGTPKPETDVMTTGELREDQVKWVGEYGPEVVVLNSFDNGKQFGYDSDRIGIWGPYRDVDGKRYTLGWTVWDNTQPGGPLVVPDPAYQGEGTKNLGDWSLAKAVRQAGEHFGVQIRLEGEPCWKDEYPRMADAPQPEDGEIAAWRMRRLAYQTIKAKARVAGGVPILDAADGHEHKRLVQEALARGEDVPERVLQDYPDLDPNVGETQDEDSEGPALSETEGPVLSSVEGPEDHLRKIWEEESVPLERQEEILADIEMKASPEYLDEFFGNYFRLHEQAPLALGKLYRDWLSISGCKESADPSEERLAQYQVWAEELVVGGEREDGGAAFRRFCRVRLAGLDAGMDLIAAGEAYNNGADYPAPEGWNCLLELANPDPEDEALEITPEDQAEFERWQLHLLTGIVGKKNSSFHQALEAITRPGALQLALERVDDEAGRRELIENRLAKLKSA